MFFCSRVIWFTFLSWICVKKCYINKGLLYYCPALYWVVLLCFTHHIYHLTLRQVGELVPMNPCNKCSCTDQPEASSQLHKIECQPIPCDTHCPVVRLVFLSLSLRLRLNYLHVWKLISWENPLDPKEHKTNLNTDRFTRPDLSVYINRFTSANMISRVSKDRMVSEINLSRNLDKHLF